MTEAQLKERDAETFVRDVLSKRKVSEKTIRAVTKKVARATPTIRTLKVSAAASTKAPSCKAAGGKA